MIDDIELLRRYAAEHSEEAFAELVRRHVNLVYHAALRQTGGDRPLVEEVTQSVFADLARKANSLLGRPVLTGWLYTSTRFAATKANRGERRRQTREHAAHLMQELTRDSAPDAGWEQLRPVIDDALHELDERDREAVLLRFFEDRPFSEVGAKLSMTEDTARVRVARALDKLHALLARRGVTSTTAALAIALAGQASVAAPAGLVASLTGTALLGTAASGGTTGTTVGLSFMSIGKFAAASAVLAVLLALSWVVYEKRSVREAAAPLAATTTQRDELPALVEPQTGPSLLVPVSATVRSNEQPGVLPAKTSEASSTAKTDSSFHLGAGDTITINVQNEPNLATTQTIGRSGEVRLPYLTRDVVLSGKTVREAERFLENLYRERGLLRAPVILVNIVAYGRREVSVLGSVRAPGPIRLPDDMASIDLTEVIAKAAGFTQLAKTTVITITHCAPDGKETTRTVDFQKISSGGSSANRIPTKETLYPGDTVFVPERFF